MKHYFLYFILLIAFISCQKEYSTENATPPVNVASGTLLDSSGNCQSVLIYGNYKENVALDYTNYLKVNITFNSIGNFTIYSDTVNGYWFYATGYDYTTGEKILTVNGYGKPILPIDANFKLHFVNAACSFIVPNNSNVVITPNTNNDYFPTTTYSNWTYFNSALNDTSIVTVLNLDRTINGNAYRQFQLTVPKLAQSDTLFYRKDGAGNYYKYYVIGSGPKTDFIFLKDYAAVGATWESPTVVGTISGNPANVKYRYTILAKDIISTIGANTIDSIITVQEETQYFVSGAYSTQNTYIYSYAKKIGLVDVNQQNAIPNITVPIRRWLVY